MKYKELRISKILPSLEQLSRLTITKNTQPKTTTNKSSSYASLKRLRENRNYAKTLSIPPKSKAYSKRRIKSIYANKYPHSTLKTKLINFWLCNYRKIFKALLIAFIAYLIFIFLAITLTPILNKKFGFTAKKCAAQATFELNIAQQELQKLQCPRLDKDCALRKKELEIQKMVAEEKQKNCILMK